MNKIACIALTGLLAFYYVQGASLNNGSVRPRGERAESSGIDTAPSRQPGTNSSSTTDQLEFDFVNLPGYGVLDEKNTSAQGNFSCYERRYGYYADINKQCTMFHLCYPVKDSNSNEIVYQRFSFACSDNSIFDQQHLLCLDESSLTTKCETSPEHFDSSNQRLILSLQQSAPGLFEISPEGAIINTTTSTTTRPELEEAASENAETSGIEAVQPSSYDFHDPAFI